MDWEKFTKDYFLNRSTLVSVFLLIDASIPAKKIDLEYASWLGQNQVMCPFFFTGKHYDEVGHFFMFPIIPAYPT